jgi:DnaJ-class molecular chaperone
MTNKKQHAPRERPLVKRMSGRHGSGKAAECLSCLGYGHIGEHGPSIDGRDRKCLDCGGTGRVGP